MKLAALSLVVRCCYQYACAANYVVPCPPPSLSKYRGCFKSHGVEGPHFFSFWRILDQGGGSVIDTSMWKLYPIPSHSPLYSREGNSEFLLSSIVIKFEVSKVVLKMGIRKDIFVLSNYICISTCPRIYSSRAKGRQLFFGFCKC